MIKIDLDNDKQVDYICDYFKNEAKFTRWVDPTIEEKDKEIERLNKCYCNRSDCAGRLNQKNEVYDSVVQRNEKAIEHIDKELCNINVQENIMLKNELLKIKNILQGVDKE